MKVTQKILDKLNESKTKDSKELELWKNQIKNNTPKELFEKLNKLYAELDKVSLDKSKFREIYKKITYLENILGYSNTGIILH